MIKETIHGVKVEHDNISETVHGYLDHLKNNISHEEMHSFVESTKNSPDGKAHFEDSHGNKVTFEYKGDGNILIRKRQD